MVSSIQTPSVHCSSYQNTSLHNILIVSYSAYINVSFKNKIFHNNAKIGSFKQLILPVQLLKLTHITPVNLMETVNITHTHTHTLPHLLSSFWCKWTQVKYGHTARHHIPEDCNLELNFNKAA